MQAIQQHDRLKLQYIVGKLTDPKKNEDKLVEVLVSVSENAQKAICKLISLIKTLYTGCKRTL